MWQKYYSVTSIDEALALLEEYGSRARIVAGATDIIIELERGQRPDVDVLIDLTRVAGLDEIREEDGIITLGPLVTHNHVVGNDITAQGAFPLAQSCWEVGAPQIRNRATVVGNLVTASPANDTITPLWALGASVNLRSVHGQRKLSFEDFYLGLRKTALQSNELITSIEFPAMQVNQRGVFLKLGLRQAQAISVINVAVILTFADDEMVTDARITLGSVAPTIIRVPIAEDYLNGHRLDDKVIAEAARLTSTVPKPIDDVRGPATYRTEMVKVLTARALRQLRDQTHLDKFPNSPAMLWGPTQGIIHQSIPQIVQHDVALDDTIVTNVNGTDYEISGASHKTLLDFLRDNVELTGTKEGCAEGECGACTVFLDDMAVMACMVPAPRAHQANIVTIEGLRQNGHLHPIQSAFVDTGAVQCGFCIPGFLMSGAKLLDEHPQPTDEQIAQSISGNLCRCTGYYKIIEAFHQASKENAKSVSK